MYLKNGQTMQRGQLPAMSRLDSAKLVAAYQAPWGVKMDILIRWWKNKPATGKRGCDSDKALTQPLDDPGAAYTVSL